MDIKKRENHSSSLKDNILVILKLDYLMLIKKGCLKALSSLFLLFFTIYYFAIIEIIKLFLWKILFMKNIVY